MPKKSTHTTAIEKMCINIPHRYLCVRRNIRMKADRSSTSPCCTLGKEDMTTTKVLVLVVVALMVVIAAIASSFSGWLVV